MDSNKLNENHKKNLEDYILVFEDILPDEFCDEIIGEYKDSNHWNWARVENGLVNRSFRNVDSIKISSESVIIVNKNIRKNIDTKLYECAYIAIKKYFDIFPHMRIEIDSGYDLLRYNEGQFYKQHIDSFLKLPRSVSCSFALNDDYEGGEFAFWNREKKIILKKGSVLMFPSNFMYPHEIMPVTKGTRYSIVTWFT